ncbi:MAG: DUF4890 domain-containing protein [Candidatus Azobacteroides sp.]|nr:DUF4890 domain-containing protein [Candidatus Azobacteroides sp.]
MKALVKRSMVLVLVSLFTLTISAQRPDRGTKMTPEERASKQTEMMTKQLNLTTDQQAKIQEINLKYSQQMADQMQQAQDENTKSRDGMKAQMEAKNAEIKQVLTPEQIQLWQEKRQEMRKAGRQGNKNQSTSTVNQE